MITPQNLAAGFPHSRGFPTRTAAAAATTPPRDDGGRAVVAKSPSEADSSQPCSEGRPKTVQGPSHRDWEMYRAIIVELYREYPLKKVSDIMKKEYGFVASKRMYDKRFREWKVFKNLNSDEKERLLRRYQAIKRGASPVEDDSISEGALRKSLRWAKSLAQGPKRAALVSTRPMLSAASHTGPPTAPPAGTPSPSKVGGGLSIAELPQSQDAAPVFFQLGLSGNSSPAGEESVHTPPRPRFEGPRLNIQEDIEVVVSPASMQTWSSSLSSSDPSNAGELLEDRPSVASIALSTSSSPLLPAFTPPQTDTQASSPQPVHSFLQEQHPRPNSRRRDEQGSISPSQLLLPLAHLGDPDPKTTAMDSIARNLYSFSDWQMMHIPAGWAADDYLGLRTISDSASFWSMIKNSLYVLKVSAYSQPSATASGFSTESFPRAFPALAKAGHLAAPALIAHPFDFVLNILATLSPVNTRANPEVRGVMLRLLEKEATGTLGEGPNHPIAAICRELQADGDCQEVSRRAIQVLMDAFCSPAQRHPDGAGAAGAQVTFKLLTALAVQLRRGGDLAHATAIVEHVVRSSLAAFGPGSDHARLAENELAHLRMKVGDLDSAMDLCFHVVRRQLPSLPPILLRQQSEVSQQIHIGRVVTQIPDPERAVETKYNTGDLDGGNTEDAVGMGDDVYHHDRIAAHAMEDLAEMCELRGRLEESMAWLRRAVSIAVQEWGPKGIATGHIIDKAVKLQEVMGLANVLPELLLEQSAVQ